MASQYDTFRKDIYKYALALGKRGITTDEIAIAFGTVPNCVSGRLTELKAMGFLLPTKVTRLTVRNRPACVWIANPAFKWMLKSWDKTTKSMPAKKTARVVASVAHP
jgi:hypothetical protein